MSVPDEMLKHALDYYGGNLKLVKEAISKGANVNAKSYYGKTILLCAIKRDNVELAKYLVSEGAKICVHSKDNYYNPFYVVTQKAENGDDEIFKYFIKKLHLTKKNAKLNKCVSNSVDMNFLAKYLEN